MTTGQIAEAERIAPTIRLRRSAFWATPAEQRGHFNLQRSHRELFAAHGGRYFRVDRDGPRTFWDVMEIARGGELVGHVTAAARNLPAVRLAIALHAVDAARAGGPDGVPRWKLRNAVLPDGAPTGPFFVALVGALEAGDIERVPGDEPGSRYRATGAAPFRRWTVGEYATAVVWAARNVYQQDGTERHLIEAEVKRTLRGAYEPFDSDKFARALTNAVDAGDLEYLEGEEWGNSRYRATAGPR